MRWIIGLLVILLGALSGYMCHEAGSKISSAGLVVGDIESMGGRTLEEAYYKGVGVALSGSASLASGLGIGVFGLSLGLGGLLIIGLPTREK